MNTLREAAQQALEALENHSAIKHPQQRHYRDAAIEALKAALAEPVLNPAPGYCKYCKQYTIEEPLPAEPVQEPVAWRTQNATPPSGYVVFQQYPQRVVDLGGVVEPLYTAPHQPLNLNDPAVQKRLAAQWGYMKGEPTSCAYPNCLGGTVGTFCHDACIKKDGHARTTD